MGLARGGILEGGRGLADAAPAAYVPGHRTYQRARTTVDIRTISGQRATDRAGAATYLGMALNTVRMFSSPAQRAATGFPAPLAERADRRDWFAITDLDAYRATRSETGTTPPPGGDPEQLLGVSEFAALRGITTTTMHGYVKGSLNDWQEHRDGYLPYPDEITPARNGRTYRWKRRRAIAWAFPDRPRTGGRIAGPAPTVADLDAVLDEAGTTTVKNREIAAALSQRLGRTVSLQTVIRLKQKRAGRHDPTASA